MESKAYSYIRFSSSKQASGDSLRRQTILTQEYCDKHNLELQPVNYKDLGVSAFHSSNAHEDAGLGQFLSALEQNLIPRGSYLLVESLDRLSRAAVQMALKQLLDILGRGITVVSLIDNTKYDNNSTAMELIVSLTVMERAYNESKTKSERIKAVWQNKRNNPHTTIKTKTCPFWLELQPNKKKFNIKEKEAEIVRQVFQLCINGYGVNKLMHWLNEQNFPSSFGKRWGLSSVSYLLNSRAVIGQYEPHTYDGKKRISTNTYIDNYYPHIIDDETYYLSQSRRNERKRPEAAGRKGDFSNIFNQLAKCKLCGSSMHYLSKGENNKYLRCRESLRKNCTSKSIRLDLIERFVIERYLSPMYYKQWKNFATKLKTQTINLSELNDKLEGLKQALRSLIELTNDFSNSVLQEEIKSRSEAIQVLEKQVKEYHEQKADTDSNIHLDFKEACQLVSNALQITVNGIEPKELSDDEKINARLKLNRQLKQTFETLHILHCPETGKRTIDTSQLNYIAKKDAKTAKYSDSIWYVKE
ncbi:recombinase family protein [Photobacterium indicum]|uniref:recombinase family protein n=1 Tax=Photobacterium indicum TaxID=81447 RepID=UPI003D0C9A79